MNIEIIQSLVTQSVGIGLVLSLVFSETLGLAAGGMVVPGYIALMLHHPLRIVGTILVSLLTFYTLRFLSQQMFIYGRRRTVMVILIGFLFGWLSRELLIIKTATMALEFQTIGLIIPGLIASWMERQGVVKTIATMLIAAVIIRLLLMIFTGGEFFLNEGWIK